MEKTDHPRRGSPDTADAMRAMLLPVTGASKRRVMHPLREPMEERLLWALALATGTFLGAAVLVNFPSPVVKIVGSLLLALAAAGIIYRIQHCGMFARRRARVAGRSARPGMLILWGWAFSLLLLLPRWTMGAAPDAVLALIGACAVGLLVLDEWRGLALLAAGAISFMGAGVALGQLAPVFFSRASSLALLALVLWFAVVWVSEMLRKPD